LQFLGLFLDCVVFAGGCILLVVWLLVAHANPAFNLLLLDIHLLLCSDGVLPTPILIWCNIATLAVLLLVIMLDGAVIVSKNAQLLCLQIWKVWSGLLAVGVPWLRKESSSFGLVAEVIGVLQKLSVDHIFTVVINDGNASNIDLISWQVGVNLRCRLLLRPHDQVAYVYWLTTQEVEIHIVVASARIVHVLLDVFFAILALGLDVCQTTYVFEAMHYSAHTTCWFILLNQEFLANATNVSEILEALPNARCHSLNLSICDVVFIRDDALGDCCTSWRSMPTIPASLHREEDPTVGAVQIVIVQILHHQKCSPVVFMSWHHDLVLHVQGAVIQWVCQEVGSEVVVDVLLA
jgi:hypothetical protein